MRAHIITDGKVSNTIEVDSINFMPGLLDASLGGQIGDLWNGTAFSKPPLPPFDREAAAAQIDAAVLAIYTRPMALSEEYKDREKAAADYKAAGYTGTVPAKVAGFATPAGMTATAAADLILSQAAQLRGALDSLSDLRMRKYEVKLAATEAAARTAHTAIMAGIATVAASLV